MSKKMLGTTRCHELISIFSRKVNKAQESLKITDEDVEKWLDEKGIRTIYESYENRLHEYKDLTYELSEKQAAINEVLWGNNRCICRGLEFQSMKDQIRNKAEQEILSDKRAEFQDLVFQFREQIWLLETGDEIRDLLCSFEKKLSNIVENLRDS